MPRKATVVIAKQSTSKRSGKRSSNTASKSFPKISINEVRPELQLPPIESAVAIETKNGITFGVLVVCALALIAVFGASIMAGIVGISRDCPNNCPIEFLK